MTFKVGDVVRCINAKRPGFEDYGVVKDGIYIVKTSAHGSITMEEISTEGSSPHSVLWGSDRFVLVGSGEAVGVRRETALAGLRAAVGVARSAGVEVDCVVRVMTEEKM